VNPIDRLERQLFQQQIDLMFWLGIVHRHPEQKAIEL
jgi:hypothetical protein